MQPTVALDKVSLKTALHIAKKMNFLIQEGRHQEQDGDFFRRVLGSALEILAEHVRNVPMSIRIKHLRLPWRDLQAMPHYRLAELIDLEDDIFWATVYKYLPPLIQVGEAIVLHIERDKG